MTSILINGEFKDTINANDRGLQYGDGLFETMAVFNNEIKFWEDHWQRLKLGCEKLSISLPDKETIEQEMKLLCEGTSEAKFVLKLIVTRGVGQRGYRFSEKKNVTRILSVHTWPEYPKKNKSEGVTVRYCDTVLSENPRLAGIKHLNRLEQVLATNEWGDKGFHEGLMLNNSGFVTDGTMSNIFIVNNNVIYTPDLSLSGVAGIMRKTIIEKSKINGFTVEVKGLTKSDVEKADEAFLTNSLFGIWPIKYIDAIEFNTVGTVTKQLQEIINI